MRSREKVLRNRQKIALRNTSHKIRCLPQSNTDLRDDSHALDLLTALFQVPLVMHTASIYENGHQIDLMAGAREPLPRRRRFKPQLQPTFRRHHKGVARAGRPPSLLA